ncbi:MAG: type II toxin-antitoxin system prevent-host-death family antitoxin [Sphingomonas sp.]|nr:type II toxin-antitoxin system prevent-host-death family antitoxin [Sphingomonas sp.]
MAEADSSKTYNVHEAKTQLSKLIDRAHAGEEIIFAKAGVPFAKLVPYAAPIKQPRQPGRFKHLLGSISREDVMEPCFTDDELEAIENANIFPPPA